MIKPYCPKHGTIMTPMNMDSLSGAYKSLENSCVRTPTFESTFILSGSVIFK